MLPNFTSLTIGCVSRASQKRPLHAEPSKLTVELKNTFLEIYGVRIDVKAGRYGLVDQMADYDGKLVVDVTACAVQLKLDDVVWLNQTLDFLEKKGGPGGQFYKSVLPHTFEAMIHAADFLLLNCTETERFHAFFFTTLERSALPVNVITSAGHLATQVKIYLTASRPFRTPIPLSTTLTETCPLRKMKPFGELYNFWDTDALDKRLGALEDEARALVFVFMFMLDRIDTGNGPTPNLTYVAKASGIEKCGLYNELESEDFIKYWEWTNFPVLHGDHMSDSPGQAHIDNLIEELKQRYVRHSFDFIFDVDEYDDEEMEEHVRTKQVSIHEVLIHLHLEGRVESYQTALDDFHDAIDKWDEEVAARKVDLMTFEDWVKSWWEDEDNRESFFKHKAIIDLVAGVACSLFLVM